ncbi:MAG: hypothetical protein AAB074_23360 [Planctomycetota bacterium]
MIRLRAALCARLVAVAFLLAGCASFEKKPPPEAPEAPPEEAADPGPTEAKEEPAVPSPAPPDPVVAKPPDPEPVAPAVPPRQELPGSWTSTSASGPGSAPVRRVDMEFSANGAWCGSMLLDVDGKKRFESLDGTWSLAEGRVSVKLSDGRERVWTIAWDGPALILRDGEAELRFRRLD